MKKYLSIIVISLLFSCKNINETTLVFDSEPAEKFIEIINYIEKTSNQELIIKKFPEEIITSNYNKNKADQFLNTKVDFLLELQAYHKLTEGATTYADTLEINGKEAYKFALFNLPYYRTQMRGDITYSWVDYWDKNYNLKASQFLKNLNENAKSIKNEAIRLNNKYYPSNIVKKDTVKTVFCIDGFRSSFTSDDIIYMELIYSPNFNLNKFTKILSHELHHINYSNWLINNFEFSSEKQKGIFKLQRGIILEGIAQQINFVDYNQQVKKLYNNKDLITELNESFIKNLIQISESKTPLETYQESHSTMWQNSDSLLEKYCTEDYKEHTISHRPTYLYYISYLLYDSIGKNGKNEEIKFVIEHPESLLDVYNNLRNDNNLIPEYPTEIVELWNHNFKNYK